MSQQEQIEEAVNILKKLASPFATAEVRRFQQQSSVTKIQAECAIVQVPLRWDLYPSSDQRTIPFFVKRYSGQTSAVKKGALWLLQGGPGVPGTVWDSVAPALLQATNYEYDIYAPDHRGTGRSNRLTCQAEEKATVAYIKGDELTACMDELNRNYGATGLAGFSTTNAAKDVLYIINSTKKPGYNAVVMGVSYGTYWLNRILQLGPHLVDAAIADSIVSNEYNFVAWDPNFELIGNQLVAECDLVPECKAKFATEQQGGSAANAVKKAFERQQGANACMPGLKPRLMQSLFSLVLKSNTERAVILPIIYRLNRCESRDYNVLSRVEIIAKNLFPSLSSADIDSVNAKFSASLQRNIVCAELVSRPFNESQINQDVSSIPPYFTNGQLSMSFMTQCNAMGNSYYRDSLTGKYPNFTKPMLSMHGTLDPQTPSYQVKSWKEHYSSISSNYKFIEFPNTPHAMILSSFTKSNPTSTCGQQYIASLLNSGLDLNAVTTECVESNMVDSPHVEFFKERYQASLILGTSDLWEGSPLSVGAIIAIALGVSLGASCLWICYCAIIVIAVIATVVVCYKKARTRAQAKTAIAGDPEAPFLDGENAAPAPIAV